jgi:hypothetical protein
MLILASISVSHCMRCVLRVLCVLFQLKSQQMPQESGEDGAFSDRITGV